MEAPRRRKTGSGRGKSSSEAHDHDSKSGVAGQPLGKIGSTMRPDRENRAPSSDSGSGVAAGIPKKLTIAATCCDYLACIRRKQNDLIRFEGKRNNGAYVVVMRNRIRKWQTKPS